MMSQFSFELHKGIIGEILRVELDVSISKINLTTDIYLAILLIAPDFFMSILKFKEFILL